MNDKSSSSDRVFWQQPEGIYPLEVFPLGLSYVLTYQPLNNLSDVHTVYTNYTSAQLYLDTGSIYFIRVAANLTESEYGPYAVLSYAKGNFQINLVLYYLGYGNGILFCVFRMNYSFYGFFNQ